MVYMTATTGTTLTAQTIDLRDPEAVDWHAQAAEMAARQGDAARLARRYADAEELRRQGMRPQRACLVLL